MTNWGCPSSGELWSGEISEIRADIGFFGLELESLLSLKQ